MIYVLLSTAKCGFVTRFLLVSGFSAERHVDDDSLATNILFLAKNIILLLGYVLVMLSITALILGVVVTHCHSWDSVLKGLAIVIS